MDTDDDVAAADDPRGVGRGDTDLLVIAVTFLPWYRQLPLSPGWRRLAVVCVVIVLLILIAWVFFLPVYWD